MLQHRTITDFGLTRGSARPDIEAFSSALALLLGPVDDAPWTRRFVEDPNEEDFDFDYTMCLPLKIFVITSAFLQDDSARRYTDMRLWQLIIDGWITEVGMIPPSNLRYLSCCSIVNGPMVRAIKREIDDHVSRGDAAPDQQVVTINSSARTLHDNPFIRVGEKVASALSAISGQAITIIKAHLVWLGHGRSTGVEDLSIMLELGPGSERERTSDEQRTLASRTTLATLRPGLFGDRGASNTVNGMPSRPGIFDTQRDAGADGTQEGQGTSRCVCSVNGKPVWTAPTGNAWRTGSKARHFRMTGRVDEYRGRQDPSTMFSLDMAWRG